ncbi:MAG TPA: hypothetical protein VGF85_03175 [Opitutaceae bacterium]
MRDPDGRGMGHVLERPKLILRGDAASQEFTEAMAVLDKSGLAYVIRDHPWSDGSDGQLMLLWGDETLTGFSHRELVDFLWAHGAKFEDS